MATTEPFDDGEYGLRQYIDALARRWTTVALTAVALVVVVVGLTLQQPRRYQATAEVLLDRSDETMLPNDPGAAIVSAQTAERRLNNELRAFESGVVRDAVRERYRGPLDPADVSVATGGETSDIAVVSVTAEDPSEAVELLEIYLDTYVEVRRDQRIEELAAASTEVKQQVDDLAARIASIRAPLTEAESQLAADPGNDALEARRDEQQARLAGELAPLENQRAFYQELLESYRVSAGIAGTGVAQVLTPPEATDRPVAPRPLRAGVLSLIVGLMAGVGLAFLRELLDERVRTVDDLARISGGLAPLGVIPEHRDRGPDFIAMRDDPLSLVSESYRSLRTSIRFAGIDRDVRTIQVTSALAGEGKTTTVANLARAFADDGERVAVVCCDLRRPRIHTRFDVPLAPGFSDVVAGTATLQEALREVAPNFFLLPGGSPCPNPSELLSSHRAVSVIASLVSELDLVVLDTTPVLPVTDALVTSRMADAVLVVVDAQSTKRRAVMQTLERLRQANAPLLGLVLNGASGRDAYGTGYGYGYGEQYQPRDAPKPAETPPARPAQV